MKHNNAFTGFGAILIATIMATALFGNLHINSIFYDESAHSSDVLHVKNVTGAPSRAWNDSLPGVIEFDYAGWQTHNISVPVNSTILSATLEMTNAEHDGRRYISKPGVDIGNDGDFEWRFDGTGYGDMGRQTQFSDGLEQSIVSVPEGGAGVGSVEVLLPRNATIDSASIEFCGASENYTSESNLSPEDIAQNPMQNIVNEGGLKLASNNVTYQFSSYAEFSSNNLTSNVQILDISGDGQVWLGTQTNGSLILDGTTTSLSGNCFYDLIWLKNGATLTTPSWVGLYADAIVVEAGCKIQASAVSTYKLSTDGTDGPTYGGGGGGGGGYGGAGGSGGNSEGGNSGGAGGGTYSINLIDMGSMGASGGDADVAGGPGGKGGGGIVLVANTVVLGGSLLANGANGTQGGDSGDHEGGGGGGGGSGGGILISAYSLTIANGAVLQAKGGNGGRGGNAGDGDYSGGGGGGGGGGRIKLFYELLPNGVPAGAVDVSYGAKGAYGVALDGGHASAGFDGNIGTYSLQYQAFNSGMSFYSNGAYESSVVDCGHALIWDNIRWHAIVPQYTAIFLMTRAGNTTDELFASQWNAYEPANPEDAQCAITHSPARYIQYRAEFTTAMPTNRTPKLLDVTISGRYYSFSGEADSISFEMPFASNLTSVKVTLSGYAASSIGLQAIVCDGGVESAHAIADGEWFEVCGQSVYFSFHFTSDGMSTAVLNEVHVSINITSMPSNVSLFVGGGEALGSSAFYEDGLLGFQAIDITDALSSSISLLGHTTDQYNNWMAHFTLSFNSSTRGRVEISSISIVYNYTAEIEYVREILESHLSTVGMRKGACFNFSSSGEGALGIALDIALDLGPGAVGRPVVSALEDMPIGQFDISPYFAHDGNLNYSMLDITSACENASIVSLVAPTVAGSIISFGELPANWYGRLSFFVNATDIFGMSATQNVSVVVAPVNDAPYFINLPSVVNVTAGLEQSLDLSNCVGDIDNKPEDLVLGEDSPFASIDGMTIIFNFSSEGIFPVNITVFDGLESASASLLVNVTKLNTDLPPTIDYFEDIVTNRSVQLDLIGRAHDDRDPDYALVWSVSGGDAYLFSAAIDGAKLSIAPVLNANGTAAIILSVRDTAGHSSSVTINVTVYPPWVPPTHVPPKIYPRFDDMKVRAATNVTLDGHCKHGTDAMPRWVVEGSSEFFNVTFTCVGGSNVMTIVPIANGSGNITFWLIDFADRYDSQTINVTVALSSSTDNNHGHVVTEVCPIWLILVIILACTLVAIVAYRFWTDRNGHVKKDNADVLPAPMPTQSYAPMNYQYESAPAIAPQETQAKNVTMVVPSAKDAEKPTPVVKVKRKPIVPVASVAADVPADQAAPVVAMPVVSMSDEVVPQALPADAKEGEQKMVIPVKRIRPEQIELQETTEAISGLERALASCANLEKRKEAEGLLKLAKTYRNSKNWKKSRAFVAKGLDALK